ncbi:MAG: winged helix-turn-helix domain-containing protein [Geobacter sp.]|jgi:transposase|nr:winged helix-turn-helix domain-containing protein [Geobacter sp.]
MARTASGKEFLDQAKELLANAKSVKELRQAQAMILPLEFNLSLEQTSAITGVSTGWVCHLRTEFIRANGKVERTKSHGGRRRENLSPADEVEFLSPFIERAKVGGILVVSEIHAALQARLGRSVALASVYNLLHRHDWRKLVPDKRHPKSDPEAQEAFKKTPGTDGSDQGRVARGKAHQGDVSR